MQLSLTSTQLFLFFLMQAWLAGWGVGFWAVTKEWWTRARGPGPLKARLKNGLSPRGLFFSILLSDHLQQHPLWQHLKMWIPELHPDFLNWGVAQKFAFLTSTPRNSSADCSLSTTATDSVDPGRWWADLGLSERLLILSEEGSCLITQPFMKHLHTVRTMCHALF